eukprot:SAG31_NODE_162_length_21892_cov_343.171936_6_plen_342_part_00
MRPQRTDAVRRGSRRGWWAPAREDSAKQLQNMQVDTSLVHVDDSDYATSLVPNWNQRGSIVAVIHMPDYIKYIKRAGGRQFHLGWVSEHRHETNPFSQSSLVLSHLFLILRCSQRCPEVSHDGSQGCRVWWLSFESIGPRGHLWQQPQPPEHSLNPRRFVFRQVTRSCTWQSLREAITLPFALVSDLEATSMVVWERHRRWGEKLEPGSRFSARYTPKPGSAAMCRKLARQGGVQQHRWSPPNTSPRAKLLLKVPKPDRSSADLTSCQINNTKQTTRDKARETLINALTKEANGIAEQIVEGIFSDRQSDDHARKAQSRSLVYNLTKNADLRVQVSFEAAG